MAPTTQKALALPEAHAEWKLYTDYPVPSPAPNEILVKTVAATVNPGDGWTQLYNPPFATYPWVGGYEGAGIIEEVGSQVTKLSKGDHVFFPGSIETRRATFQEYTVVPEPEAALIPDNISFEQATVIPMGIATIAVALWAHHPEAGSLDFPAPWEEGGTTKFAGQPAFVVGGASSVGQLAIQFAKLQGFSPIIATASLRNEELLKSRGATHVVDRTLSHAEILERLPKLTGGKPILYAFDAIARDGTTQHLAYDAVAPGGGLVVIGPRTERVLAERVERDGGSKKIARPLGTFDLPYNKKLGEEVCARLTEWVKTGVVVPNNVEIVPNGLLGVQEACKRHVTDQVHGCKLVVRMTDTP